MFDLLEETGSEAGSEDRFHARIETHKKQKQFVIRHHFWWVIHNCIAHPLIGVCPINMTFRFHDWTSEKINGN